VRLPFAAAEQITVPRTLRGHSRHDALPSLRVGMIRNCL
jgi:hypothetical protein